MSQQMEFHNLLDSWVIDTWTDYHFYECLNSKYLAETGLVQTPKQFGIVTTVYGWIQM